MALGDMLRQNSKVGLIVAILALLASGALILSRSSGPEAVRQRYFFDLDKQQIIIAPLDAGRERLVMAHVYSCTSCSDEASRFVTLIEKANPDFDPVAGKGDSPSLVSDPRQIRWISPAGAEAQALTQSAAARCRNPMVSQCLPQ